MSMRAKPHGRREAVEHCISEFRRLDCGGRRAGLETFNRGSRRGIRSKKNQRSKKVGGGSLGRKAAINIIIIQIRSNRASSKSPFKYFTTCVQFLLLFISNHQLVRLLMTLYFFRVTNITVIQSRRFYDIYIHQTAGCHLSPRPFHLSFLDHVFGDVPPLLSSASIASGTVALSPNAFLQPPHTYTGASGCSAFADDSISRR